jgi:hypothetical protein
MINHDIMLETVSAAFIAALTCPHLFAPDPVFNPSQTLLG